MIYGSVCSGIEAASCAWHPLGWEPAFFSEIDAFPRAVLQHRFPEVPLHGDFTTIQAGDYRPIDLLVGGTPCQSFSIAGLRKGLDDDRGNLALEYLRLADRLRPQWLVWENVPGVLSSSGGRDFGAFLGGLVELGYGFAYRVLDAQFFGVAQRRRRVFVVGYLGDWRPAAAVLFERHSLQGHPAPSRGQGAGIASAAAGGVDEGGGVGALTFDFQASGAYGEASVAATLSARDYKSAKDLAVTVNALTANGVGTCGADDNPAQAGHLLPTAYEPYTLAIRGREGGVHLEHRQDGTSNAILTPSGGRSGAGVGAVCATGEVFHALTHEGFDASEDGTGRGGGAVATAMRVRRLTPTECERLQGFPDGWTQVPYRGKPASDGPRYKAIGNSMAVPVMAWIGRRIAEVNTIISLKEAA